MRIVVLGSIADDSVDSISFKSACKNIGAELSKGNHTVVVCSENENSADPYIVMGINSDTSKTTTIEVISSEEDDKSPPFFAKQSSYSHVKFTFKRCAGGWKTTHLNAILNSDLLLIVGGKDSVWSAAHSALMLNKPVVALPCFGGTSRKVWDKLNDGYKALGLSATDLGHVRESWTPDSCQSVIKLVSSVFKNHAKGKNSNLVAHYFVLMMSLIFISAWVLLFNKTVFIDDRVSIVVMVLLCSTLGVMLRGASLDRYFENWKGFLSRFIPDAVKGILIGFILTLVHLFSELTINGSVSNLSDSNDFVRISLSVSLIAFFAGFSLENSFNKLKTFAKEKIDGVGK